MFIKCLNHWYAVSRAYVTHLYHYTGQVGLRFGDSGSLEEWKWCHNFSVEAEINLRPLHTSVGDIYKVFESLLWCLKGIWLHPYTVTPSKLLPDLGSQVHLRSENDAIMSWVRLVTSTITAMSTAAAMDVATAGSCTEAFGPFLKVVQCVCDF